MGLILTRAVGQSIQIGDITVSFNSANAPNRSIREKSANLSIILPDNNGELFEIEENDVLEDECVDVGDVEIRLASFNGSKIRLEINPPDGVEVLRSEWVVPSESDNPVLNLLYNLQQLGFAMPRDMDDWADDVYFTGSTRPVIIKRVQECLDTLGGKYPNKIDVLQDIQDAIWDKYLGDACMVTRDLYTDLFKNSVKAAISNMHSPQPESP